MRKGSGLLLPSLITLLCLTSGCNTSTNSIRLDNPVSLERSDETVVISRKQLTEHVPGITDDQLPVPTHEGTPLPSQWDDMNGDGYWDELAFLVDMKAGETGKEILFELKDKDKLPEFETRTNIRFGVMEEGVISEMESLSLSRDELPAPPFSRFQMDGPVWENDKIGFRQYFDGRNARDLFGKLIPDMALDTVGISDQGLPEDDYHVMLPWGRDILAVGNSLGIGGIGILANGTPVKSGIRITDYQHIIERTTLHVLTEGPVRSVFSITYTDWETTKGAYTLTHTSEIRAGMFGYLSEVSLKSPFENDTLLVGIVNINFDGEPVLIRENDTATLYTHDKQSYEDEWYLGMALVFPDDLYQGYVTAAEDGPGITNSFLNRILLGKNTVSEFRYLTVAGWELSDPGFRDAGYFEDQVRTLNMRIQNPIIVR